MRGPRSQEAQAAPTGPLSPRLYPRKPKRVPQIVLLPPDVRAWVKACAERLDVEISELAEAALYHYLDALDRDRQAHGLAALPRLTTSPEEDQRWPRR